MEACAYRTIFSTFVDRPRYADQNFKAFLAYNRYTALYLKIRRTPHLERERIPNPLPVGLLAPESNLIMLSALNRRLPYVGQSLPCVPDIALWTRFQYYFSQTRGHRVAYKNPPSFPIAFRIKPPPSWTTCFLYAIHPPLNLIVMRDV